MRFARTPFWLTVLVVFLNGCGWQHLAQEQVQRTALNMGAVYDRETDLELARAALPAGIKFLEGALAGDTTNVTLLIALSRALGRYSWGFIEREAEYAEWTGDSAAAVLLRARARLLYRRAATYGERALRHSGFPSRADSLIGERAPKILQDLNGDVEEGLFWTAFAWGNLIGSEGSLADVFSSATRVRTVMERVSQSSDTGLAAQAHCFLGVLLTRLPPLTGGDMQTAKTHFDRAIDLTRGSYLPARLAYARFHLASAEDAAAYERELREITEVAPGGQIGWELDNAVARRTALDCLTRILESTGGRVGRY